MKQPNPNGQDQTLALQFIQKITTCFSGLLIAEAMIIFPSIDQIVMLDADGELRDSRTGINATRIPVPDVSYSTVGIYLPQNYPSALIDDTLAEASRIAYHRILFLSSFVPINSQAQFQAHAGFLLSKAELIKIENESLILSVFDF